MKYIVDRIIPAGKIHFLSGSPGAGKTTILFQMLDKIRKGEPVLGFRSKPCKILYISGDGDGEMYEQLAKDLGIEMFPMINIMDIVAEHNLGIEHISIEYIQANFIDKLGWKPDLIVLDPPDLLLKIGNFNDKVQVASGFFRAWKWIKTHGYTLILSLHNTKVKKNDDFLDVMDRVGGSASIQAYSSTKSMLVTERQLGEDYCKLILRGKRFPEQEVKIFRGEQGKFFIPSAREVAKEEIPVVAVFDKPEMNSSELVDALEARFGIHRRTCLRQIKEALDSGILKRKERGIYTLN